VTRFPSDLIDDLVAGIDRAALSRAAGDVSSRYRREQAAPLQLKNDVEALAYAAARMPATFAAVDHVLAQLDAHPQSVFDFGAGPGTGALVARHYWPDADVTLLEPNASMRGVAQKLVGNATFADAPQRSDIVMAAYVLNEVADPIKTVTDLWNATADRLVLIDTGTSAVSAMMRGVRAHLIDLGAHIHAPCPHQLECPFAREAVGWCHFSVRLERTKLHKALKDAALGYEDEKFTYLIAGRSALLTTGPRVIGYPRIGKVVDVPLCMPEGVLHNAQISKRDARYKQSKKLRWGDVF